MISKLILFILFTVVVSEIPSLEDLQKRRTELEDKLKQIKAENRKAPTPPKAKKASEGFPRVYVLDDFVSEEECQHVINVAKPLLQPSTVTKNEFKSSLFKHNIRESETANDDNRTLENNDPIISDIMNRIHEHLFIPIEFGEPVQFGHYKKGNYYEFHKDSDTRIGRIVTFLIYLNDVESGGATIFPGVNKDTSTLPQLNWGSNGNQPPMAPYCQSSSVYKVKPKRGRAVIFFSHNPDMTEDKYAIHGSCPIKSGEKWILQRWLRIYTDKSGNTFFNNFFK